MIRDDESRPPQAGQYRNYSRMNEETDWTNAGLDENPQSFYSSYLYKSVLSGGMA